MLRQSIRTAATMRKVTAINTANLHGKLSDEVMEVINATVPVVAANIGEITKNFYPIMFENNPEVLQFFNLANQRAGRQPAALADSVVAAVTHLDDIAAIAPALELIAHKHCALGVLPEHYQIVHDNFLVATAKVLGDAVTPQVASAWSAVLMHVAGACIDMEKQIYDDVSAQNPNWDDTRLAKEFVVHRAVKESDTVRSLYFKRADGSPAPTFVPGQYVTLHMNVDDDEVVAPRHYTVSSDQAIDDCIRISVRYLAGSAKSPAGRYSEWLHQIEEGTKLKIRAPFGVFTRDFHAPEHADQEVYLSTGIGVTTVAALLPDAVKSGAKVAHFHCGVNQARHPMREELEKYDVAHREYVYDEQDESKRLTPNVMMQKLEDAGFTPKEGTRYFICGSPEFLKSFKTALLAEGVKREYISHELFGPAINV